MTNTLAERTRSDTISCNHLDSAQSESEQNLEDVFSRMWSITGLVSTTRTLSFAGVVLGICLPVAWCTNLALGKPTMQDNSHDSGPSHNAVDGNTDNHFWNGLSCALSYSGTMLPYTWWGVDLLAVYDITHVVITRRGHSEGGYSLNDLQFDFYTTSPILCHNLPQVSPCAYHGPELPLVLNQTCESGTRGRYLIIRHASRPADIIIVCEVEVFGTPAAPELHECTGPRRGVKEEGVKVEGEGLIRGLSTTRAGCSLECAATPLCEAFSFNPSAAECVLSGGLVKNNATIGWQTYKLC